MDFTAFFSQATQFPPFPYQVRLAQAQHRPALLKAPTGSGKTEAIDPTTCTLLMME